MNAIALLVGWLVARLQYFYRLFVIDLGMPTWFGYFITLILIGLFFYALYDIFIYRNKGETAFIWLVIVLVVPLGSLLYIAFGRPSIRKAPIHLPRNYFPPASAQPGQLQEPYNPGPPPKKYFLGATTVLGSVVATIALVAGCIVIGIFILIIIAYIQCINDPKCM